MTQDQKHALTKVPAVTLGFWIIKVLATTLGETGGDTVTRNVRFRPIADISFERARA